MSTPVWTVTSILAVDRPRFFELFDLEQSVLDQLSYQAIRYIFFLYDQESGQINVLELRKQSNSSFQFDVRETIKDQDIYESKTLIGLLQKYVTSRPTERNMVITWGHGSGLGFFSKLEKRTSDIMERSGVENVMTRSASKNMDEYFDFYAFLKTNLSLQEPVQERSMGIISKNLDSHSETRHMKMFLDDMSAPRQVNEDLRLITAHQLGEIFEGGFGHKAIDVLLTINCYGQLFETGFELMDKVTLMVSPQTTIPFAGVNYLRLFSELERNPHADLKLISEIITGSFDEKYSSQPLAGQFKRRYPDEFRKDIKVVSFSGNFLSAYKDLLEVIDEISGKLLPFCSGQVRDKTITHGVSFARSRCIELATTRSHGVIDLENFLTNLVKQPKLGGAGGLVTEDVNRFMEIKLACNASIKKAAPEFYKADANGDSMSPSFISAFFPFGKKGNFLDELIELYFENKRLFMSSQITRWDEFVEACYRNLGRVEARQSPAPPTLPPGTLVTG